MADSLRPQDLLPGARGGRLCRAPRSKAPPRVRCTNAESENYAPIEDATHRLHIVPFHCGLIFGVRFPDCFAHVWQCRACARSSPAMLSNPIRKCITISLLLCSDHTLMRHAVISWRK